jgi:hypothetical protein
MATARGKQGDDKPVGHSGWVIPLGIFVVTFFLSGLVLLFYLAPQPRPLGAEQISPTQTSNAVALRVGNLTLNIPANYLQFESARQSGNRKDIALFALLPDMQGYSAANAAAFASDAPSSQAIYLLVREDPIGLSPSARLARIYMPYITTPKGEAGPFGLTKYSFREDSGYRQQELFVGPTQNGPLMLLCAHATQEAPGAYCLAIDRPITKNVSLSYRFKRAHLARWREINNGVDRLIAGFAQNGN